ncbi:MAG: isopenicillin N synthase-like dioxygenase [Myxococcota bacterium]|jgi:isopenicillin N synthase-like dioxygenase
MPTGVPLVNLSDFHDPLRRGAFVQALGDAIKDLGFVRVTGHSLDPDTVQTAYQVARDFFYQPSEAKDRYLIHGGAGQRGYTPFKAESAKDSELPDLKEFWHVGRELAAGHPLASVYPPNIWPEGMDAFRSTLLAMFDQLETCSNILLSGLSEYLGQGPDRLVEMVEDGNNILRVLHYPSLDDTTVVPGAVRAAAHEDINLITLLITSTASGLQLKARDGSWLDIDAEPGEIVADSGDMLSRLTNGVIPSTTHRVVNPDDPSSNRFSMPYFVHPRPEVSLRVLDNCRGPGFATPPPDITAQGYLDVRLEELGLTRL